jgi:leucyl aminopeptidase
LNATLLNPEQAENATPLWLASDGTLPDVLARLSPAQAAWVRNQGFQAEKGRVVAIPDAAGAVAAAIAGVGPLANLASLSLWEAAPLPERLPAGCYRLASTLPGAAATQFALGWLRKRV